MRASHEEWEEEEEAPGANHLVAHTGGEDTRLLPVTAAATQGATKRLRQGCGLCHACLLGQRRCLATRTEAELAAKARATEEANRRKTAVRRLEKALVLDEQQPSEVRCAVQPLLPLVASLPAALPQACRRAATGRLQAVQARRPQASHLSTAQAPPGAPHPRTTRRRGDGALGGDAQRRNASRAALRCAKSLH